MTLSPQILTPVSDRSHEPPSLTIGSDGDSQPVSLLTALIQSSDKKPSASTQSSAPSTAFSSPRGPNHGILQQSNPAILRRDSNDQVGLGLGGVETLKSRLEKVEEKRERIGWADAVDQPQPTSTSPESDDEGYQEDSEEGFDSDNSQDSQIDPRYPFARPTNFDRPRFIGATQLPSKTPAPALLPPPARRGRGHIKVDETAHDKTCSRHRSPPPARSRSSSAHKSSGRLSDAGPRDGRAGSPMPDPIPSDEEEDEEEMHIPAGGWRSDDAVFYGPNAQHVRPIRRRPRRHSSALRPSVFVDSDDETQPSGGIGDFLRRASEHIPGFRRPSSGLNRVSSGASESGYPHSIPQAACPPALDNTPAMAQQPFTNDATGGLAHRLETALSSSPASAAVSRVASVNMRQEMVPAGPVTAQPIPRVHDGEQLGWTEEALLEIRKSRKDNGV
ncbi:uncharacterized protein IL334_004130 [Kwoniella shivajii]|uniref:Uncharacterized protein n=1 Tax=Kwoniella shivajii TaxID=564305 RepID=A0ABZ1CZH0_9TREE|nr:hypothetical protein IL334_004130 [Kwoniella shivajii]